jgi:hypothetical protein
MVGPELDPPLRDTNRGLVCSRASGHSPACGAPDGFGSVPRERRMAVRTETVTCHSCDLCGQDRDEDDLTRLDGGAKIGQRPQVDICNSCLARPIREVVDWPRDKQTATTARPLRGVSGWPLANAEARSVPVGSANRGGPGLGVGRSAGRSWLDRPASCVGQLPASEALGVQPLWPPCAHSRT